MRDLKKFSFTIDVSQEDGCMLEVEKLLAYPKYIECLQVDVEYRVTVYRAPTYYEPEEPREVVVYQVEVRKVWDLWSYKDGTGNVWTPSDKQRWLLSDLVEEHFQEQVEVACWENEDRESKEFNVFRCSEFGELI